MNSLGLAVFCAAIVAASAGIHGVGLVGGPGSPAVIAGPSGTVVRGHGHGGVVVPGIAAHGAVIAPAVSAGAVIAPGIVSHGLLGAGWLGHGLLGHGIVGHGLIGSGIEGQYIPDHSELLYDDGSYKPHVYGH